MLLIKTVKKRLKYLSKIQLSRRLKVDLWGDILYTQANSRLFKRFLRKRVYSFRNYFIYGKKNSRHPLKIPKNRRFFFKTKRFLYILRHNRSFLNWFKTFKHHDRVFFSRQIRFKTLRNLLYKNPSQFSNVKSLLLPQVTKFGQLMMGCNTQQGQQQKQQLCVKSFLILYLKILISLQYCLLVGRLLIIQVEQNLGELALLQMV